MGEDCHCLVDNDMVTMSNVVKLDVRLRDDVNGFYARDLMVIACSKCIYIYEFFSQIAQ